MNNLADVISRLEKAEGPDRQLDADIYKALGHEVKRRQRNIQRLSTYGFCYPEPGAWLPVPRLTGSIDAAVALAEKVLNVYTLELEIRRSGARADVTWFPPGNLVPPIYAVSKSAGKTPALAICIAVLKALQEGRS